MGLQISACRSNFTMNAFQPRYHTHQYPTFSVYVGEVCTQCGTFLAYEGPNDARSTLIVFERLNKQKSAPEPDCFDD